MVFYKRVRNMKKKTVLVIGILGLLLVFGAAVALAQNASEKKEVAEDHECTPEMMEDMSKNCPEQMMQSCENMMNGDEGCGEMMSGRDAESAENDHCTGMGSDMDSMMGSGGVDMKGMM